MQRAGEQPRARTTLDGLVLSDCEHGCYDVSITQQESPAVFADTCLGMDKIQQDDPLMG